ncbi:hypothetical protein A6770_31375 [Nostoc minutum NIES-26]|uniref:Uncharacterized protein n=1 Tax=Nostoc minutum NIES-26 TaxID=1844469 RepID=A0A367Q8M2_9NOSO|nr:hypothetical protein A6770_31375 [Nostoc minutum NIES-26]
MQKSKPFTVVPESTVLLKKMNKVEYLILKSALQFPESLYNIPNDYKISNAEVAYSANNLFKNREILAEIVDEGEEYLDYSTAIQAIYPEQDIPNSKYTENSNQELLSPALKVRKPVVLTPSQIEANLSGELGALYYLTPKGASRWESLTNPDWNRYVSIFYTFTKSEEGSVEVICLNQEFIEKYLNIECYVAPVVRVKGTEIWDVLEPWSATYWKTLPKGYRLRVQSVHNNWSMSSDAPTEWIEANDEANELYNELTKWYTEPKFD